MSPRPTIDLEYAIKIFSHFVGVSETVLKEFEYYDKALRDEMRGIPPYGDLFPTDEEIEQARLLIVPSQVYGQVPAKEVGTNVTWTQFGRVTRGTIVSIVDPYINVHDLKAYPHELAIMPFWRYEVVTDTGFTLYPPAGILDDYTTFMAEITGVWKAHAEHQKWG